MTDQGFDQGRRVFTTMHNIADRTRVLVNAGITEMLAEVSR